MINLRKAVTVLLGSAVLMAGTVGVASAGTPETGSAGAGTVATVDKPLTFRQAVAKLESGARDPNVSRMTVSGATNDCVFPFTFQSAGNGRFVSSEFAYSGRGYAMLRARADGIGEWELYTLCKDAAGFYSIQSFANGRWVTANLHYPGGDYAMLTATSPWVNTWEQFEKVAGVNGGYALRNRANRMYVAAELDYWWAGYAMLRARSYSVGYWETFF